MENSNVAVYARRAGNRNWKYVGVYKKNYANKGSITYTYGQSQPAFKSNHFIFPSAQKAPHFDLKFSCPGYKTHIVRGISPYKNHVFALAQKYRVNNDEISPHPNVSSNKSGAKYLPKKSKRESPDIYQCFEKDYSRSTNSEIWGRCKGGKYNGLVIICDHSAGDQWYCRPAEEGYLGGLCGYDDVLKNLNEICCTCEVEIEKKNPTDKKKELNKVDF